MRPVFLLALLLVLASCGQPAPRSSNGAIEIQNGYVAPSPAGVDLAAGYLTIANSGDQDQLVAVSSPRAAHVALHTMAMDGMVMRMRMVETMIVPAHGALTLSAGGDHLMFTGLNAPFKVGESVPVHLRFEHGGEIDATLPISVQPPRSGH